MNKLSLKILVSSSIALATTTSAFASWVQWAGNGHWYEAVATQGITWWDAESAAESQGAYLATLTSKDENDFVFGLIDSPQYWFLDGSNICGPWFGGIADNLKFSWVTGETWGYSNWLNGDPGLGGPQYRTVFWSLSPTERANGWNDVDPISGGSVIAYIKESDTQPVPEPRVTLTLVTVLSALVLVRKAT